MSKIEDYNRAKSLAERLSKDRDCTLGLDSPTNDKHSFIVKFNGLDSGSWQPMKFTIETAYGYYGSSSGYSSSSVEMGQYLARAISARATELLVDVVRFAEADAEKARIAALDEARAVLEVAK